MYKTKSLIKNYFSKTFSNKIIKFKILHKNTQFNIYPIHNFTIKYLIQYIPNSKKTHDIE